MDLMNGIASGSVGLSEAQFTQQYTTSVIKKTMDFEAQAAQELLEMLPRLSGSPAAGPALGQYIDVYA